MSSPDSMGGDGGQARDVGQRPTVDQVRTRSFTREHVVDALRQFFPVFVHPAIGRKTGDAKVLQEALIALLSGKAPVDAIAACDGQHDGARKTARTAAYRPAPDEESADATAARAAAAGAFVRQFIDGDEDMTYSVRLMLDSKAAALPKSLEALRAIEKNFVQAEMAVREGCMLPHKLVKSVRPCVEQQDSEVQKAMFAALKADLEKRLAVARAAKQSQNAGGCGSEAPDKYAPDPVLVAMGDKGRDRALWEYYKASVIKCPAFGQRTHMPFDSKSYIGQLFSAMKLGLAVDEQRRCKHLQTAKKLRDFVVAWCHFYAHTSPPFVHLGNKKDWTSVQWEQLPMHELVIDAESDQGVPVSVHVAAFSHVCDVVLYLQTPAEPKPGRLAEISRGQSTPAHADFSHVCVWAGQSDGRTAVSDGGGQINEHDDQPEDQEMEGGDPDSEADEDDGHAAGDERAFARMQLGR
jgi:hypothetical protein